MTAAPPPPPDDKPRGLRWPRFSIGTVLLLFTSFALCYAIAVAPPEEVSIAEGLSPVGRSSAVHYGLLAIATSAVVWSLARQASGRPYTAKHATARIAWIAVVAGLIACLAFKILVQRHVVEMSTGAQGFSWATNRLYDYCWSEPFPDVVWYVLLFLSVTMLAAPSVRQPGARPAKTHWWVATLAAAAGLAYILFVGAELAEPVFSAHLMAAKTELGQSLAEQRPGTFPDVRREEYFSFWLSVGAIVTLVATSSALALAGFGTGQRARRLGAVAFVAGVVMLGGYDGWFFLAELPRLSPDLAAAWAVRVATDWAGGAAALVIGSLWAAGLVVREPPNFDSDEQPALACSRAPNVLAGAALVGVGVVAILGWGDFFRRYWFLFLVDGGWSGVALGVRISLLIPEFLFRIALAICGLRLLRTLWRPPPAPSVIPTRPFVTTFLAILMLAVVAIPTLTAWSFCSWLGPWWR